MCRLCQRPTSVQQAHMRQLAHTVGMNTCGFMASHTAETLGKWGGGTGYGSQEGMWLLWLYLWDCGLTGRQRRPQQTQEDGQPHCRH